MKAGDLIGAEGEFRLPGGRTVYEAVEYNESSARGMRPRLARLAATDEGIHQVNRWVDWDQPVEVLRNFTEEAEAEREAELADLEREWGP